MRYKDFFLIDESWKDYKVSTNPEILLYDFYVVSYLSTLPLDPAQKGFSGTLIGRDANEIKLDIKNAEDKLLPVLRDKLSEALFIAICAEIRHITDRDQNYKDYKNNKLLKNYLRNYGMFKDDNLPDEFKPTRNVDRPQQEPSNTGYLHSFKAATKAIKDTGSSREQFATLCAELFRKMEWPAMYGGKKWAEIADAYVLLNKTPQTNAQLQVAIDHAYDLQHNTGTVLNKVKTYYNKGDISWLEKALDFKANLKNVYSLLPRCSSDMRKLALEAFKTAGIKKGTLETTVAGDAIKAKSGKSGGSTKTKDAEFKAGDFIKYKAGSGIDTIEINGVVTSADGMDEKSSFVNITKIITLPQTPSAVAYDWKVGQKVSLYKKYMTKLGEKTTFKDTAQFKVGDLVHYVNNQQFKVGDLVHYVNAQSGDDLEGIIDSVEAMGYFKIKITKVNDRDSNTDLEEGNTVLLSGQYMTNISSKSDLKIGDVGTLDIQGNIYEVKILGQASENSFKISIIKPIEIKYKGFAVGVGKDMFVGTSYLKSAFKSYNDTNEKPATNEELKVGQIKTVKLFGNIYNIRILRISERDNPIKVIFIIHSIVDNKNPVNIQVGQTLTTDISTLKDSLTSTTKEEDIKVGDTVTFEIQDNKYQGVVTEKVTNDTLRVKVEKTLEKKNNYVEVGQFVTMNRIHLKRVSK